MKGSYAKSYKVRLRLGWAGCGLVFGQSTEKLACLAEGVIIRLYELWVG